MARCGRCGLWSKYPDNHKEDWSGFCLWYQTRLKEDEVFQSRECDDFFESIPGVSPMDALRYKTARDNIGSAHDEAMFSRRVAIAGTAVAVVSMALSLASMFGCSRPPEGDAKP